MQSSHGSISNSTSHVLPTMPFWQSLAFSWSPSCHLFLHHLSLFSQVITFLASTNQTYFFLSALLVWRSTHQQALSMVKTLAPHARSLFSRRMRLPEGIHAQSGLRSSNILICPSWHSCVLSSRFLALREFWINGITRTTQMVYIVILLMAIFVIGTSRHQMVALFSPTFPMRRMAQMVNSISVSTLAWIGTYIINFWAYLTVISYLGSLISAATLHHPIPLVQHHSQYVISHQNTGKFCFYIVIEKLFFTLHRYRTLNMMCTSILPGPKEQNLDQIQQFLWPIVSNLLQHGNMVLWSPLLQFSSYLMCSFLSP